MFGHCHGGGGVAEWRDLKTSPSFPPLRQSPSCSLHCPGTHCVTEAGFNPGCCILQLGYSELVEEKGAAKGKVHL